MVVCIERERERELDAVSLREYFWSKWSFEDPS